MHISLGDTDFAITHQEIPEIVTPEEEYCPTTKQAKKSTQKASEQTIHQTEKNSKRTTKLKRTSKQAHKQANKQANKQTKKQRNEECKKWGIEQAGKSLSKRRKTRKRQQQAAVDWKAPTSKQPKHFTNVGDTPSPSLIHQLGICSPWLLSHVQSCPRNLRSCLRVVHVIAIESHQTSELYRWHKLAYILTTIDHVLNDGKLYQSCNIAQTMDNNTAWRFRCWTK